MNKKLQKIKEWLVLLLLALLALRVFMICLSYKDAPGQDYYLFRQVVYTISWLSIFVFFSNYQGTAAIMEKYIKKMKTITFFTMLASALRLAVSVVYLWPLVSYKVWPSLYNVLEIAVWVLITLFFYFYWRKMSKAKEI
ncbi:MAG: hypothetical protein IKQ68_01310 [Prevotella sp.]|nr:hypothetical protein [Prevotella sp.]